MLGMNGNNEKKGNKTLGGPTVQKFYMKGMITGNSFTPVMPKSASDRMIPTSDYPKNPYPTSPFLK
jgi:hypothetical protein